MVAANLHKSVFSHPLLALCRAVEHRRIRPDVKVEGVIKGRSGSEIILQTADSPKVIVLLTDSTDVAQVVGASQGPQQEDVDGGLIPGLPDSGRRHLQQPAAAGGSQDPVQGQRLGTGASHPGGFAETQQQAAQNKEELEKQNAALARAERSAGRTAEGIDRAAEGRSTPTRQPSPPIPPASASSMSTTSIDEVTVLFGNGKIKVDPKYNPQFIALAEKAKSRERLHDPGERLCFIDGQCRHEPEAQRSACQTMSPHPAAAGSYPAHQHAGAGCDGRKPPGRSN